MKDSGHFPFLFFLVFTRNINDIFNGGKHIYVYEARNNFHGHLEIINFHDFVALLKCYRDVHSFCA